MVRVPWTTIFAALMFTTFFSSANASHIHVNKAQWHAISPQERQKIVLELRKQKVLKPGDRIVPTADAPAYVPGANVPGANQIMPPITQRFGKITEQSSNCHAACWAKALAAGAVCNVTTAGLVFVGCMALVVGYHHACDQGCPY
jgi:hypothetical protein